MVGRGIAGATARRLMSGIGLLALFVASCAVQGQAPAPGGAPLPPSLAEGGLLEAFSLSGGSLRIVLPRGALTVRPSSDGQVRVRGRLAAGQRLRQAAMPGGHALRVLDDGRLVPAAATLDVEVPAEASLSIDVEDAELDLDGVGGQRLRVEGGARPLRLVSAAPEVRVWSRSGPLTLRLSGQRLSIASVTGEVDLVAPSTGVQARIESVAGSLQLQLEQPGPMRVETVSGRIDLRTGQGSVPVTVETVTGDIDLRLAKDTSAALKLEPGAWPMGLRGSLNAGADGLARVGDGRWPLRLATLSGRLTVRQGTAVLAEPEPHSD